MLRNLLPHSGVTDVGCILRFFQKSDLEYIFPFVSFPFYRGASSREMIKQETVYAADSTARDEELESEHG